MVTEGGPGSEQNGLTTDSTESTTPQEDSQAKKLPIHRFSRRAFLKWGAGLLAAYIGGKLVSEKPTPIPEDEKTEQAPLRSPYFWAALDEVRKKHPEQEGKVRQILEKIDQQGALNAATFQPAEDPNLRVPFTKVSLNHILPQKPPEQGVSNSSQKEIYVIFAGFAYPPAGHPFTPWDIVYDRVISSIPAVLSSNRDVEVYSIGFPQGLGGKVSTEYVEGIKAGFEAYGRLYGQFVKKVFGENDPKARVVLQGMSFGSTMAELAARELDENQKKRVQLLLDNPAADHGILDLKDLQVPVAFLGESFVRTQFDPRVQSSMEAEKIFLKKFKDLLSQKGIEWEDDQNQADLKQEATRADIVNLIKGSPLETDTRLFIRRGIWDPLSFPSAGFLETLRRKVKNKIVAEKRGKSLEFGIGATHFINRYRVDKWSRILKTWQFRS